MPQPVEPQISLGPSFSDSWRVAFAKYNTHQHWVSVPSSFLFEDIRIGDAIQLVNARGVDVFSYTPPIVNPVVDSFTATAITSSVVAREAATNATLMLPSGRSVRYVNVEAGSNQITRSALSGMLSPLDLESLLTKHIHGTIELPPNTLDYSFTRTVALSVPVSCRIASLKLACTRMAIVNDHRLQLTVGIRGATGTRYLLPTIEHTTQQIESYSYLSQVSGNLVDQGEGIVFYITYNSNLVRFDYSLVLYQLL